MGNNHNKFFSTDKRKLLVVGYSNSGKSSNETLVQTLKFKEASSSEPQKTDLEIYDIKVNKHVLCIFDLGGQDRQRIFWRQNFYGSQGILYVIDATDTEKLELTLNEFEKIVIDPDLSDQVPIAVFMNKGTFQDDQSAQNRVAVNKAIIQIRLRLEEEKVGIKQIRYFEGSSKEYASIMLSIDWLLLEMKAI